MTYFFRKRYISLKFLTKRGNNFGYLCYNLYELLVCQSLNTFERITSHINIYEINNDITFYMIIYFFYKVDCEDKILADQNILILQI